MRRLKAAVDGGAIVQQPNLTVDGAEIEEYGGLIEVDVLLGGCMASEDDGVDVEIIQQSSNVLQTMIVNDGRS